ncbi:antitoxin VbhA family protein [Stenotrophomonas sp. PD6]|uniref:antitoxin VbhA family protein n=1 Tax=Stenotrophomonas sp. PD6 TaxID=3368612 RepID=UPI003BA3B427
MSKDVFMQLRIEPELRANFQEAVALEHRPAAQVIREFMREYVAARLRPEPANQEKRMEAVRFAAASVALEGLSVSSEAEAQARRFVNGEISLDELVAAKNG